MRLIDADDIGNYLFDRFERSRSYNPYDRSNTIHISDVLNIINDMPTIEERKFGKWHQRIYSHIEMMVCSECNSEFSYDAETGVRDYNYCPHCGAKMRG